jgi:hypothetical protein
MKSKLFEKIINETPFEVKQKVYRELSLTAKIYGIKRKLLHKKYKPDFPKAKNKEQGRLIFILSRNSTVCYL